MNAVTKQIIVVIGPTILKSVINSMLTEEQLIEYRDEAIEILRGLADKTENQIDDALVETAVAWVMEPGNYIEHTQNLCTLARRYVTDTENGWDDMLILPILDRIEQLGVGE